MDPRDLDPPDSHLPEPTEHGSARHVGPADPPVLSNRRTVTMLTLAVGFGIAGVLLSQSLGRLDSALLFVGVPLAMALAIGLVPTRDPRNALFQAVTVALLLSSALLHEGALCVLLASPLVYAAAYLALTLVTAVRERSHRALLLPVLVLAAFEGVFPALRVSPNQDATAQRVVASECATFERALDRGPQIGPEDRGLLLRLAQYPTPQRTTSTDGLKVGSVWTLTMPAGAITTRVTSRAPGKLAFDVTEDTARTTRWVTLQRGTLTWRPTPAGCTAAVTVDYRRHLDPGFWFGPVTEIFMDAGARAFLASLD